MSLSGTCDKHDWSWDPADDYGCPVCHGIKLERKRTVKILKEWLKNDYGNFDDYMKRIKNEDV